MPENVNTSVLTIDDAPKTEEVDNRETMIKIDHVSMVFNMASDIKPNSVWPKIKYSAKFSI